MTLPPSVRLADATPASARRSAVPDTWYRRSRKNTQAGGRLLGQDRRGAVRQTPVGIGPRRPADRCPIRIRFPVEHGNGNHRHQLPPAPPVGQLGQIVGADQPDQTGAACSLQPPHRIDGVAGAEPALEIAHHDPPIAPCDGFAPTPCAWQSRPCRFRPSTGSAARPATRPDRGEAASGRGG